MGLIWKSAWEFSGKKWNIIALQWHIKMTDNAQKQHRKSFRIVGKREGKYSFCFSLPYHAWKNSRCITMASAHWILMRHVSMVLFFIPSIATVYVLCSPKKPPITMVSNHRLKPNLTCVGEIALHCGNCTSILSSFKKLQKIHHKLLGKRNKPKLSLTISGFIVHTHSLQR